MHLTQKSTIAGAYGLLSVWKREEAYAVIWRQPGGWPDHN